MGNPDDQRVRNGHQNDADFRSTDARKQPKETAESALTNRETATSAFVGINSAHSDRLNRVDSSNKTGGLVPSAKLKARPISLVLVAFALFAALNVVWSKSQIGILSALDFPHQTWTGTAIDDFLRNSKGRSQLAFLGSSLMVTPIISVDADFLHQKMDAPYHHHSVFFESKYKELTGRAVSTFNLSIPGEMPSDAYMLTKFLLKGEKRPDVIVYGVGPRDFIDNLLPSASATDPYKHLSRMGKATDNDADFLGSDWQESLNFALGQTLFTYGHKDDIACSFSRGAAKFVVPHLPEETAQQEWEYKQMVIPDYRQFAVLPQACLVAPTKSGAENEFKDNLAEYKDRYRELKWDTFLTQMKFLAQTLNLARERQIQTVLVAMPITDGNRSLISNFVWKLYKQNLKVVAQAEGATYIDMQKEDKFVATDFADTVHLNARGGTKLLTALADRLKDTAQIETALAPRRFDDASVRSELTARQLAAGAKQTRL